MKVTAHGHVHRSEAEWRAVLQAYARSGLAPAAFCAREGIVLSSFQKWVQRLESKRPERATFVELVPAAAAEPGWAVELELPTGIVVRVRG